MAEYPDHRTEYIQSPQPISTRKLARKWKIPYKTVSDQCRHEGWVEQRRRFQGRVRAESEHEAVETLAQARVRWAKEFRTLQAVGLKALKTLKPRTAGEAARLVEVGIKGEVAQRAGEIDEPPEEDRKMTPMEFAQMLVAQFAPQEDPASEAEDDNSSET